MDIQPRPLEPLFPHIEVPILSTEEYDCGDFNTYPERQGWHERSGTEWIAIFKNPPVEFVAFLERWLFFGSLYIAFGDAIKGVKFTRTLENPRRTVLTLENLPSLFPHIRDYHDFHPQLIVAQMAHMALSKKVIGSAHNSAYKRDSLVRYIMTRAAREVRSPEVVMATSVLGEMLFNLMIQTVTKPGDKGYLGAMPSLSSRHSGHMWTLMRQAGWCPLMLMPLFNCLNTSSLYYLYNIPRPHPEKVHRVLNVYDKSAENETYPVAIPELCDTTHCTWMKFDDETYRTKHADGCPGDCKEVVANPDELCEILLAEKIPLILSVDDTDEEDTIKLVAAEPGMAYVAISHVWSDGLGNTKRNAIPRCQMRRLSKYVRSLENMVLFWFDTVCVPPDASGLTDAQNLAMSLMRKTYEDAQIVLVLDAWLFNTPGLDRSDAENLMRVLCSSWTKRLWTYQEGVLAKQVSVQFSDGPYDIDKAMERFMANADDILKITLLPPIYELYNHIRRLKVEESIDAEGRESHLNIVFELPAIASALGDRRTSVLTDEPLCLGALLGLNVLRIARTEPEQRMEMFWRMLKTVPEALLFNKMDTFDIDGLRWAPKTLMAAHRTSELDRSGGHIAGMMRWNRDLATVSPFGLIVNCDGIVLHVRPCRIRATTFVRGDRFGTWYQLHPSLHETKYGRTIVADLAVSGNIAILIREMGSTRREELDMYPDGGRPQKGMDPTNRHAPGPALIVEVVKDGGRLIRCKKLAHALWQKLDVDHDAQQIEDLNARFPLGDAGSPYNHQMYGDGLFAAVGVQKTMEQVWCIG
ncbi:hypothetical protein Dda_6859 [Drechslerella dactyloides]|uniref:Heterokaryon incompatibility domain-containing protein n=1 Tax=Drechslerella dactyloides TaxID=74499 RepID=A0AAD6NHT0_DREDA|nr:hypothetical protein Dda_6859 [Drechslerella dactyloides]